MKFSTAAISTTVIFAACAAGIKAGDGADGGSGGGTASSDGGSSGGGTAGTGGGNSVLHRNWRQIQPATTPPARYNHAVAYDEARQRVVLYGGQEQQTGSLLTDTWEWDGTDWSLSATSGLQGHGFAELFYDSQMHHVIGLDDFIWQWDGTTWTRVATVTSPRLLAAASYDSDRSRYVVFGGIDSSAVTNDAWEWNRVSWVQRTGGPSPGPRYGQISAYDAVRKVTVVFGGVKSLSSLQFWGDTWTWDGTSWSERFGATAPASRAFHTMVYDSDHALVLVIGGMSSTGSALSDVWAWNGTSWAQEEPPATFSSFPLDQAIWAAAYDSAKHQVVMFGFEYANSGVVPRTWVYE